MGAYDFQKATADRIAEILRAATIDENGQEMTSGGQRRVLLADEVGLGKTIIAREVISRVREMRREVGDDMFRVVYVCSNMNIVRQNIAHLGIKEKLDVSESRLSMQHLIIAKKDRELRKKFGNEMPEMIIPLTPGTSFVKGEGRTGTMQERALIAVVTSAIEGWGKYSEQVREFFRGNRVKEDSADWWFRKYERDVADLGEGYIEGLREKLGADVKYVELKARMFEIFTGADAPEKEKKDIISSLRRIFADISLTMLEPDLIIMDEFQRFSSLLEYNDNSEQSAIVKKFFEQEGGQQPMILLLSATPYKPLTTLEELNEDNVDKHYEDFNRLMDFLYAGNNEFREIWADYSRKLSHLSTEKFDVILASKKTAEDKMYEGMCRTERLNEGLISTKLVEEIPVTADDIISYREMQTIVSACREAAGQPGTPRIHRSTMPVEYVKSSPYLLSFMDSYELKKQIEAIYHHNKDGLPLPSPTILLREREIAQYHKIALRNARLQYLRDMMFPKGSGAELLLWVPASKPYYTTNADNPFVKNKDFSKTLVFSAWEMVPRMISVMLTYEAERNVIFSRYKKASYDKRTGGDRIRRDGKARELLKYPSRYLAALYDPAEHYGERVHSIRADIRRKLTEATAGIRRTERRNYAKILRVVEWLDNPEGEKPEEMPANTVDVLTDMAIASPGVCLYRIVGDRDEARKGAEGFVTLFNRRIAGYIIDKMQEKYHSDEFYLDGILDYCVKGNLQAVLDEYRHLCADDADFIEKMGESFIREVPLQVDTFESFHEASSPKKAMRTFYAVPFTNKKNIDEKAEKRSNNIRIAFQSPFYPFVLSSTSVGQEGLDFHWYCRKIVHWNLPSNPQDLEQREGRINRYKCLAIRRNIARRYPDIKDWGATFARANEDVRLHFGEKYSEIVPNWCLPVEWLGDESCADGIERIERIVPQYPMSNDVTRYQHLIDVLALYRLTLGQPRQEELLEMLDAQNLTEEQIDRLLFNLSPIKRAKE